MDFFSANRVFFYVLGAIAFLSSFYFFFFNTPSNFPKGMIFNLAEGSSLRNVSLALKKENIIRSRILFEALVILRGGEKHIISADYLFEDKVSSTEVARRILKGERHLAPIKITVPEGFTINDISEVAASKLLYFNKDKFLISAKEKEGYLFPDTYFFLTTADERDVIESMSANFKKKISMLEGEISQSGQSQRNIIIMASVIEKESKGDVDRDIISGILWKRLGLNMPLQADAAPGTYQTRGLPQNPIGNPGLVAIKAALYPQNSPYLYYLHDKGGNIHYAKSFAEHRQNILKYLK